MALGLSGNSASSSEPSPRGSNEKKQPQGNEKSVFVDGAADIETGSTGEALSRDLHGRHLQFIAIGAALGTGLFIGIGSALAIAGPGSLLIAFLFVGLIVYSVMVALGEIASYLPVAGSFTVYAGRFVDPTLGFSMGWIYWFSWVITFGLELTAAGLIIQYWNSTLSIGIWIAVFGVIFTLANFLPIRWFGEVEMYLSSIKVVTVVGFVIFAICVNAGTGREGYIGFKYWREPGAFNEAFASGDTGRFVAFWATLITAGFSFQGTELVAVGAGETANPRKTIPSAIRWTYWGIFSLFIATVFFVGINVPYTDDRLNSDAHDASASPLVLVAIRAGVSVVPDIINAVLLTAVLSAANSDLYSSSRILIGLAEDGHAPRIFKRTNRFGTPYYSVGFCCMFGCLGFLNLSSSGKEVFDWLLSITSVAGFITWSLINYCHIRFMKALKAQNVDRSTLPYVAPFQPYLSWFGLFFNILIILTSGFTVFIKWNTSNFFAAYVSVLIFVVFYVVHKAVYRTKVVPLTEVDLVKGRSQ
ncbi:Amino acid/polyamine transporter I [Cordyceps fumosorosea ARSEF 2679]|uniref:Amino acid/polyamine transporter I n=1 Tax=Cordyceps fumosorosea (strain ARSEF 2679) TaxID=1081104 RepID=A0A162LLC8_CORFA|nr:Amino acid/polyamine transporter I [Cordyceps fumosorosea ARSEF 2679]OAA72304.1 Amino acid/polyamine transporter I [Cordyceps fumosorosea ARSEF 2679]